MFRRLFIVAALAGLIAGLANAAIHQVGTVPLIHIAETYEQAAETSTAPAPAVVVAPAPAGHGDHAGHAGHSSAAVANEHAEHAGAWEPEEGFERISLTVLADVLTGIGFALLLTAAYALRGDVVGWRQGLLWGLAGFAVFTAAPGLGLPPEVPGAPAAPLADRQLWWALTALATAAGLGLIVFTGRLPLAILGVALIVAPHFIGAPPPLEIPALAPESLAHRFVSVSVATSFVFWAMLGGLTGFFQERLGRSA